MMYFFVCLMVGFLIRLCRVITEDEDIRHALLVVHVMATVVSIVLCIAVATSPNDAECCSEYDMLSAAVELRDTVTPEEYMKYMAEVNKINDAIDQAKQKISDGHLSWSLNKRCPKFASKEYIIWDPIVISETGTTK